MRAMNNGFAAAQSLSRLQRDEQELLASSINT
jgi:hypothetical protein